jgi:hypothetical protein
MTPTNGQAMIIHKRGVRGTLGYRLKESDSWTECSKRFHKLPWDLGLETVLLKDNKGWFPEYQPVEFFDTLDELYQETRERWVDRIR